jgi:outer membrane protein assembly factor BamB
VLRLRLTIAAISCFSIISFLPASAAQPPPDAWPQILHDAGHTSHSNDHQFNSATAPTIGINWMTSYRSADLGGPVTAFNSTLGTTMAYMGDERGDLLAFNETNGAMVWSSTLGYLDFIRSTPMVAPDGSVWAATGLDPTLYKLDGTTGKVLCSMKVQLRVDSSIMFATPPGGVPTVYTASVDASNAILGKVLAVRESDCGLIWAFNSWRNPTGAWATPAFGVDAKGKGLVLVGSASPDDEMYAMDALTGKLVWYRTAYVQGDFDIGAAAAVSPVGNNGFKDGVLYYHSKYGIMYAVDLTTGKPIWQYQFASGGGGISSPALYKTTLVYGVADGVEALNAVTGKLLWHYNKAVDVVSSPAITGLPGKEIVAVGDSTGRFFVLRLADGAQLYSYQTGNYITSSPSIINGHILIASTDSFLYDFVTGGANVASPTTVVTSPTTGSKVANPDGSLIVSGTASDSTGVAEVQYSVQQGGPTGPYFIATTGTWTNSAFTNFVAVDHPGQTQSTWSFPLPVPAAGSTYQVTANAVDVKGQADRTGAQPSFTVLPESNLPRLTLSTPIVAPGSTFTVTGKKFGPSETVDFSLQGKIVAHGKSTKSGSVPKVTIKVSATASFGPSALSATGETSKKTTTAPIDITNVWTQSGYDSTHSGYEPNDKVLEHSIEATHNGYLSRAWLFMTGAAVAAAPAVLGGSAYVANTVGTVNAVDTVSGAPFWTYTIPTNAAIHAAPAVGNGDVVFGADDSTLYRLASATGVLIGSAVLDGIPTSPALVNGTIYVGTANGTVYAIDESTGTLLWSTPVGAAIHYSPAVDAANGLVIVGDDAGNITSLASATGAQVRQTSTGGASVTVSPEASSGQIIVGSSDGNLRAFDEKTDTLDWTYTAGSAIHALASDGADAYAGDDAGNIARVDQKTGKETFLASRGSAIEGLAHVIDFTVDEETNGYITGGKDSAGDRRQYDYKTGAGLSTQPAIVDGAVFIGAGDGGLYAFTDHGQSPENIFQHKFMLQLAKNAPIPASWPASFRAPRAASSCRKPSGVKVHGTRLCP